MKSQDPFGFVKALQVPKDKKTIDKVHKILFKKRVAGFKTNQELRDFVKKKKIKALGYGWDKKLKHFVEYD